MSACLAKLGLVPAGKISPSPPGPSLPRPAPAHRYTLFFTPTVLFRTSLKGGESRLAHRAFYKGVGYRIVALREKDPTKETLPNSPLPLRSPSSRETVPKKD